MSYLKLFYFAIYRFCNSFNNLNQTRNGQNTYMTHSPVKEWCNCLDTVLFIFSCLDRYNYEECQATAVWLLSQTAVRPLVGIVCGSGLGGLADMLKDQVAFNYSDIPNFPQSTGMCFYLVFWMILYSLFLIAFYPCSTYFVMNVF